MTPLIPALINLLVSGIRKKGGGGGGYGGGGGRPEQSQQEKSDYYWTGKMMKGELDDKNFGGDSGRKGSGRNDDGGIIPWSEHVRSARG